MLKLGDFDFYYLIICSRGPGSETITVSNVSNSRKGINFTKESEAEFKQFGICEAEAEFNEEGPILAVPIGTKPLKGIYAWLKKDSVDIGDGYPDFDYSQAYLSACLRVFLTSNIKADSNPWTSVNAWRTVEVEIPNKAQFEALMEATGETAEQIGQWNCTVLKEATKRYLEGTLPEKEFRGC